MAKKTLEELVELALEMNIESRKAVLDKLAISERTWSKWIKDTGIYFERTVGAYIVPNMAKAAGAENSNVTDFSDYKKAIEGALNSENDDEILDVTELANNSKKKEEPEKEKTKLSDLPIYTPDDETKEKEEPEKEPEKKSNPLDENSEDDKPVTDPKKDETEKPKLELVKEKFMVTKDILKALKCKALTEGVEFDELVRDLLIQSIEKKYFVGAEQGLQ